MEAKYFVLDLGLFRVGDSYQCELAHADPTSQAQVAPLRAAVQFDLEALLALQGLRADYGAALSAQLFADPDVKARLCQVEIAAQATGSFLRFSLRIDPSAQELHGLWWELLRHPVTDALLTTSETLLFSRFMVSRDWRPVKLRARSELVALIAVSAPVGVKLAKMDLAPVDFEGEVGRVQAMLGDIKVQILGGPGAPFTLDRLIAALRDGVDVLYLVSHGMFGRSTGTPTLLLQDDTGDVAMVKGEDLAARVGELQRGPRLVVLASCQSAGDGGTVAADQRTSVQATLAGRLADAGVPAIIAMQGFISMTTVASMMPVFFAELGRDGQIDRAVAVARGAVRGREDCWMPALYTRLNTGQLWYTPGFRGADGEDIWQKLLLPVRKGKLVPILGPGLLEAAQGTSFEIARELADSYRFPLAAYEWDDLPRVTQYLSVTVKRFPVVQAYKDQITTNLIARHKSWLPQAELDKKPSLTRLQGLVADHLREQSETDCYRMLADLPACFYVTTNHDSTMERALKAKEKVPRPVLSRWRYKMMPASAEAPPNEKAALTGDAPVQKPVVVYHAFGIFGKDKLGKDLDDTLVLTEDDYFDYLIKATASQLMPDDVGTALVDNSLLFLGFRLTDWSFRVLFRLMRSLPGIAKSADYPHVAVQFDPELQSMEDVEGARNYLKDYFKEEPKIEIYWGTAEEFLTSLRDALARGGVTPAAPEEDEDEFVDV